MKKTVKAKWIKALRSGKYRQDDGQLCRTTKKGKEKFCCLGVLCEISGLGKTYSLDSNRSEYSYKGQEETTCLPKKFRRKIGLKNKEEDHLIWMNDAKGKSFSEIADYIEKNL